MQLLNDDKRGVLFVVGGAGMQIEIPAAGSHLAGWDGPGGVAVGQQACPGALRAPEPLDEAQRAKNRNHAALFNLDQQ